jgi:hypothetical protein
MKYHYKRINYEQLDKKQKVEKGKVVLEYGDWKMVKDYILFLESELHQANGSTFGSIEEELIKRLGEEKVNQYYK